jgi:hypothetical protein
MNDSSRKRNSSPSRPSSTASLITANQRKIKPTDTESSSEPPNTEKKYSSKNMDSFNIRMNNVKPIDTTTRIEDEAFLPESTNKKRIVQTIVDLVVIVIVLVAFGLVYVFFNPTISYFTCNDTDIFYPYKSDTIKFWVAGLYGALGPLFFIIFVELLNAKLINCCSDRSSGMTGRAKTRQFLSNI